MKKKFIYLREMLLFENKVFRLEEKKRCFTRNHILISKSA